MSLSESKHFKLLGQTGKARRGRFTTDHGEFSTPNFMPVGTKASVKGVDTERLVEIGAEITLVNTYHLWIRPGPELIAELGGIHKFCSWNGPILSDSGGYQVFSLQKIRKIQEEGVEFRSHLDGEKKFLSPEQSIEIQEKLGVDIAMVLDECPAGGLSYEDLEKSLGLTIRWAKRSLAARRNENTSVFAITQGGTYPQLRERAAGELSEIPFDGLAIGGLSVGEPKESMYEVLSYHVAQLPEDKTRYLMGVGTPEDIVQAVREGVDIFDCVIPTRAGRFGRAYVRGEIPYLNLRNKQYQNDPAPLDETCSCLACRCYSRAYLSHLFRVREMLGPQLLSIHNLTHYLELMKAIQEAIKTERFEQLYQTEKKRWSSFVEEQ